MPRLRLLRTPDFLEALVPWKLVCRQSEEACRWECIDGRWVTISLDVGPTHGYAVIQSSAGERETTDSFDEALAIAKRWRTWE